MPTKNELQERIAELEEENETLNSKIDAVVDLFASEDGDDATDGDDDQDVSDEDDDQD